MRCASAYSSGDHDTMTVTSCNVVPASGNAAAFVEAKYTLTDDYGGNLDVTRRIRECE